MDKITLNGTDYVKASGVEFTITREMVIDYLKECDYGSYLTSVRDATRHRLENKFDDADDMINGNADDTYDMLMILRATE